MRYYIFNSKKSLTQNRLIFDKSYVFKVLENFHFLILIIFPFSLSIGFLLVQLHVKNSILLPLSVICLFISAFIARLIIIQIKKSYKFRKTTGVDKEINMKLVEDICLTNKWKILASDNHSHVIKIENTQIGYHTGRELFIMYQDTDIFLRCLTYGTYDIVHPFHWISQREIEDSLVQNLKIKWLSHTDKLNSPG